MRSDMHMEEENEIEEKRGDSDLILMKQLHGNREKWESERGKESGSRAGKDVSTWKKNFLCWLYFSSSFGAS